MSSPRQHTPGPWRTEPAPHRSHWILGATSVALTTEPNEANARLIAAAPTMFDYLTLLALRGDNEAHEIIKKIAGS